MIWFYSLFHGNRIKIIHLIYISCVFFSVTFQRISMCNASSESFCNFLKPNRERFIISTFKFAQMPKISFSMKNYQILDILSYVTYFIIFKQKSLLGFSVCHLQCTCNFHGDPYIVISKNAPSWKNMFFSNSMYRPKEVQCVSSGGGASSISISRHSEWKFEHNFLYFQAIVFNLL